MDRRAPDRFRRARRGRRSGRAGPVSRPGLVSSSADASFFFGRENESESFLNRLRAQPLITVVGPSGAGKSSFVQAGIVPRLPAGWRARPLPRAPRRSPKLGCAARRGAPARGAAPTATRSAATSRPRRGGPPDGAGTGRERSCSSSISALRSCSRWCAIARSARGSAAALVCAARTAEDPVRLIFTLRATISSCAPRSGPELRRTTIAIGVQLLATPAAEDLQRILVEPAQRSGYQFEDSELPLEMVRDVVGTPGALALLSFTASKLWDVRDRQFRQLTRKAYQALGGVGGALGRHAEDMLGRLVPAQQALVREAFRHLVTADGTRAVLTRAELDEILGGDRVVAVRLIAERLLTSAQTDAGDTVEIVHEALLGAWPRLVEWRRADAEGARLRDQLRATARQWDERAPAGLRGATTACRISASWRFPRAGGARSPTSSKCCSPRPVPADASRGRRIRSGCLAHRAPGSWVVPPASSCGQPIQQKERERLPVAEEASGRAADSGMAVARDRLLNLSRAGRLAWLAGEPSKAAVYLGEAQRQGMDTPAP